MRIPFLSDHFFPAPSGPADDEAPSTAELVRICAGCLKSPARLIRTPEPVLRLPSRLLGRQADFERLCGSSGVDARATHERLGWRVPLGLREGLRRTVAGRDTNAPYGVGRRSNA